MAKEKNVELWTQLALAIGFNEIAKQARTLGEKMFARVARDAAEKRLVALGGNNGKPIFQKEEGTKVFDVDMPERMPWLIFRPSDIELMRQTVAEWDEKKLFEAGTGT